MNNQNQSRNTCRELAIQMGWKKDRNRNVIETSDGELWSFSVYTNSTYPECRQVYEDTVGFIGVDYETRQMVKYRVRNFAHHKVSRISPSGVRAFNVRAYIGEAEKMAAPAPAMA